MSDTLLTAPRSALHSGLSALAFAVLTVGTLVVGSQAYDVGQTGLMTVLATILVASVIPLTIWAVVTYRQVRGLGAGGSGPLLGVAGGVLAAVALATSAALTWAAAQSHGLVDPAVTKVFTEASCATGGSGFDVGVGLLIGGFAMATLSARLLSRAVAWTGLVIAVLSMLSTLSLLTSAANLLIPVGRFGGLLWILAATVLIPRAQPERRAEPVAVAAR